MHRGSLKYLIVADSKHLTHWQLETIKKINGFKKNSVSVFLSLADRRPRNFFLDLFEKWIYRKSAALKKNDPGGLFLGTEHFQSSLDANRAHELSERSKKSLLSLEYDFIVSFSNYPIPICFFKTQDTFLYRYHFDGKLSPSFEASLLPSSEDAVNHLIRVVLTRVHPLLGIQVLKTGYFKNCVGRGAFKVDQVLLSITCWISAALSQKNLGFRPTPHENVLLPAISKSTSLGAHLVADWLGTVVNYFKMAKRFFTYQKWNVGYTEISNLEDLANIGEKPVKWLPEPAWPYFIADPFLVYYKNALHAFAEVFNFTNNRGHIAHFEVNKDFVAELTSEPVLRVPWHTSYPCVFEFQGSLYCVPETLEPRELTIFKCHSFPTVWTRQKAIFRGGQYADPTIFKHKDLWWLFYTEYDRYTEGSTILNAFYSTNPLENWQPHAQNPIKIDVRSARGAGTPFVLEGRLFRPSQDCSMGYGGSINLNEITRLSPFEFEENVFKKIEPLKDFPDACHHLSVVGSHVLLDGKIEKFSLRAAFLKMTRFLPSNKKVSNQSYSDVPAEDLGTQSESKLRQNPPASSLRDLH